MRLSTSLILTACLVCITHVEALGQGDWEFLGPEVGYRPEAFFVSQGAIYLGLSDEDETGLGLYRYRFNQGEWELFAWEGYRILGVTVWGESDENILLIRYGSRGDSDVSRSTDGGETWVTTYHVDYWEIFGLTQAPSDTARVLIHFPVHYSTDGGWSWDVSGGIVPWNGSYDAAFDPSDPLVAYLTGQNEFGDVSIFKSTNGGANWFRSCYCASWGIDVDRGQTNRVMGGPLSLYVRLTTDAGETWPTREAPLRSKAVSSPGWSAGSFYVAGSDQAETTYEVWRTEDFAESWYPCGGSLPELPGTSLRNTQLFLEGHPTEPVLYAALEGSGVWQWDVAASAAPDMEERAHARVRLLVHPNPSTDGLTYGMRLPRPEHVVLRLLDVRGRLVTILRDGVFPTGTHVFRLGDSGGSERPATSGIYYVTLDAAGVRETAKIVLVK